MGLAQGLLGLPELGRELLTHVLGGALEPVFHAAMSLIAPAFNFGDGRVMVASYLSCRGLASEDVHDQSGLALGDPSLDRVVIAHPVLQMVAL